ncbi:MAG TPA: FAD-binding oxidoreductase [Chryseolinea sp.]
MEEHIVKVRSIRSVTHDVLRLVVDKPAGYTYVPGQATEVAINKAEWREQRRPFTFTSLPGEDHLEFTIKTYPSHSGVTNALRQLKQNDELLLHDVWGAIAYKGEGVFIAGGAGVTPFIAILRDLDSKKQIGNNVLIFANKTRADIIDEPDFQRILADRFINILSDEKVDGYAHGMINEDFLKGKVKNFMQQFYVCGPPPMMDAVLGQLKRLGVGENAVTVEI